MVNYNSSELAKQIAVKLGLGEESELALYNELSQMPNGAVKCAIAKLAQPSRTYVGLLKGSCVRDAQYAIRDDAEHLDDDAWVDAKDTPLYLGTVEADTEIRARQLIAIRERVDTSVVEVHNI